MQGNLSHPELATTILLLALVALFVRAVLAQSTPTSQLQSWLGQATLT
jgi:hypothetical protein